MYSEYEYSSNSLLFSTTLDSSTIIPNTSLYIFWSTIHSITISTSTKHTSDSHYYYYYSYYPFFFYLWPPVSLDRIVHTSSTLYLILYIILLFLFLSFIVLFPSFPFSILTLISIYSVHTTISYDFPTTALSPTSIQTYVLTYLSLPKSNSNIHQPTINSIYAYSSTPYSINSNEHSMYSTTYSTD